MIKTKEEHILNLMDLYKDISSHNNEQDENKKIIDKWYKENPWKYNNTLPVTKLILSDTLTKDLMKIISKIQNIF